MGNKKKNYNITFTASQEAFLAYKQAANNSPLNTDNIRYRPFNWSSHIDQLFQPKQKVEEIDVETVDFDSEE